MKMKLLNNTKAVLVPTTKCGEYIDMKMYTKNIVRFVEKEFFLLWAMTGILAYLNEKEVEKLKRRVQILEAKAVLADIRDKTKEKTDKEE